VSAFEAVDDGILARLDKGHTVADAARAVGLLRDQGIEIRPSFVPFTPWTTLENLRALLAFVADHDLVGNVDPVQYTIRLLIPQGSLLLDLADVAARVGAYDADSCTHPWAADDPALDELQTDLAQLVELELARESTIEAIFGALCEAVGVDAAALPAPSGRIVPAPTEPWFCCAEPLAVQFGRLDPV
jgi:hypothetical protein